MKRRKFSPEEKVAIVLEGLRGEISIAELCRKHEIKESQYYRWREQFLEAGEEAFTRGKTTREKALEAKIRELERVIGRQTIEIEILKKTLKM